MIARLFGPIADKLVLGGLLALAFVLVLLGARKAGRDAAVAAGIRQQLKNVEVRNEVEREVGAAGPDAVRDELRKRWTRD